MDGLSKHDQLHKRMMKVLPAPDEKFLREYRDLCLEHNRYIDLEPFSSDDLLHIFEIGPDASQFERSIQELREGVTHNVHH